MHPAQRSDVYLEQGRTWTFACAVDWPGWARRGKGDEAALEELLAYADRYALVVPGFVPGELHVVGTLPGSATTDFGALDGRWPVRYAVRRFAWHVLDHAWEIEDKQPTPPTG